MLSDRCRSQSLQHLNGIDVGACLEMALLMDLPAIQMSIEQLGYIPPAPLPMNVTGQMDLTQAMTGPVDNGTAATRGYVVVPSGMPYFSNASQVIHQSQLHWRPVIRAMLFTIHQHVPVAHHRCS